MKSLIGIDLLITQFSDLIKLDALAFDNIIHLRSEHEYRTGALAIISKQGYSTKLQFLH